MEEYEFNSPLLLQDALVKELENQGKTRIETTDEWEVIGCLLSFSDSDINIHNQLNELDERRGMKINTFIEMVVNKFVTSIARDLFFSNKEYDLEIREFTGVVEDEKLVVRAIIGYK